MKRVEFAPAARAELDAAATRYESERSGRGLRFYAAVERSMTLISRFPEAAPRFPGTGAELGVRRWRVRGFPFSLAYRVRGDAIRIEAVAHMHRRPGYWQRRQR